MKLLILFFIHNRGWCSFLHEKKDSADYPKGWCPVVEAAYRILEVYHIK